MMYISLKLVGRRRCPSVRSNVALERHKMALMPAFISFQDFPLRRYTLLGIISLTDHIFSREKGRRYEVSRHDFTSKANSNIHGF